MSIIAASISAKLLEIETSNLVHGFVWKMPVGVAASRNSRDASSMANVAFVGCRPEDLQRGL